MLLHKKVRERVKQLREDVEFERVYEKVEKMGLPCDTPTRSRKVPKRYNESEVSEELDTTSKASRFPFSIKAEIKRQYVEVIDKITASGEKRFSQEDISFMQAIEALLISSINGKTLEDQDVLIREVTNRFKLCSFQSLKEQLKELHLLLRMYNNKRDVQQRIIEVTKVSSIIDIVNDQPASKECMEEVDTLLRIYQTIPLSSASAERTFSAMRRLKSWIRAKTGANHLNNIMFANLHKGNMDEIDIAEVAREFIQANSKREHFFGKF